MFLRRKARVTETVSFGRVRMTRCIIDLPFGNGEESSESNEGYRGKWSVSLNRAETISSIVNRSNHFFSRIECIIKFINLYFIIYFTSSKMNSFSYLAFTKSDRIEVVNKVLTSFIASIYYILFPWKCVLSYLILSFSFNSVISIIPYWRDKHITAVI